MSADPQVIQQQPKGTFATYVRGLTDRAVPMSFPFFVLEKLPRATKEDIAAIRQQSRQAYAQPWSPKVAHVDAAAEDPAEPPEENEPSDPLGTSPEF